MDALESLHEIGLSALEGLLDHAGCCKQDE